MLSPRSLPSTVRNCRRVFHPTASVIQHPRSTQALPLHSSGRALGSIVGAGVQTAVKRSHVKDLIPVLGCSIIATANFEIHIAVLLERGVVSGGVCCSILASTIGGVHGGASTRSACLRA